MTLYIGSRKAFAESFLGLLAVGLVVGLGVQLNWEWLDRWWVLACGTILVIGSGFAVHRRRREPGRPVYLVSLLPPRWRRWVLGENDRSRDV